MREHKLHPSLKTISRLVSEGTTVPNKHYSENFKQALDTKRSASALLMDLSQAFDRLYHDLVISKLNGFSRNGLKFTSSYLSQSKQRVK